MESWFGFDIKSMQHELDDKVIEIAQQLEEGDNSRKRLIEQTKEFRKSLAEEQRKLVAPILKLFQVEVDASTKRSKLMEQVLLKVYKQLIDLPDPRPALENAQQIKKRAERVQDLEIENRQLRDTLEEYNVEFAQVKNQEVTIKMLKDKIKEMEEKSEQSIQSKLREKEKELQRTYADKEEALQSTQLDLVKKLGDTEAKLLSAQTLVQKIQVELFEMKQKQDEVLNAKTCEVDILMQDLDKVTERAVSAERLLEQYFQMSAKQQQKEDESSEEKEKKLDKLTSLQSGSYEIELAAKEKEISQLVEDIQKLQFKSSKSREFYETQRAQLEEKLSKREKLVEELENELKEKLDYEEIKRELNILKSIEFTMETATVSVSNENTGMITNLVGAPAEQPMQKPLEILLLEKNRQLQNENTQIKNRLSDLQVKYETVTKEFGAVAKTNLEQKTLIVELEKDLLKLARTQQVTSPMPNIQTQQSQDPLSPLLDSDQQPPTTTTSNQSVFDFSIEQAHNTELNSDVSLLNIVSNQRERFRMRVQELESENMAGKQQVLFLTNEIDRLRSDNVKLYEKIKFLQSVNNGKKSPRANDLDEEEGNVLNKYSNEYERKLDPFSNFSYREKQKRYTNLQLHDKFTLNFSRFILSNKTSRLIFCAYFLVVHLLIFVNLYNVAHHDASRRDLSAECASSYKDHMHKVHGLSTFDVPH